MKAGGRGRLFIKCETSSLLGLHSWNEGSREGEHTVGEIRFSQHRSVTLVQPWCLMIPQRNYQQTMVSTMVSKWCWISSIVLWTKSISHHMETMAETIGWVGIYAGASTEIGGGSERCDFWIAK